MCKQGKVVILCPLSLDDNEIQKFTTGRGFGPAHFTLPLNGKGGGGV
jgi:hypothetical protein